MSFSQKSVYALRAVYVLASREGEGQISIASIAEEQKIPPRFLENILIQLKQAGIVKSIRGKEGGYLLARPAKTVSIGDILRSTEGAIDAVSCLSGKHQDTCPMREDCIFLPMWNKAQSAMFSVFDNTFFSDLVEEGRRREQVCASTYSI